MGNFWWPTYPSTAGPRGRFTGPKSRNCKNLQKFCCTLFAFEEIIRCILAPALSTWGTSEFFFRSEFYSGSCSCAWWGGGRICWSVMKLVLKESARFHRMRFKFPGDLGNRVKVFCANRNISLRRFWEKAALNEMARREGRVRVDSDDLDLLGLRKLKRDPSFTAKVRLRLQEVVDPSVDPLYQVPISTHRKRGTKLHRTLRHTFKKFPI